MPDSYTRSRDIERDIEWDIEQDGDDNATSARLTNDLIDSTDLVTWQKMVNFCRRMLVAKFKKIAQKFGTIQYFYMCICILYNVHEYIQLLHMQIRMSLTHGIARLTLSSYLSGHSSNGTEKVSFVTCLIN